MKFRLFFTKTFLSIIIVSLISIATGFFIVNATATGGLRILGLGILDNTASSTLSIDTNNRQLWSASSTTMNLDWFTASTTKVNNIFGILGASTTPFYTYFQGGNQTSTITYTLPTAQGASSTVLTNNGSGTLSWAAGGSSGAALLDGTNQPFTGNVNISKALPELRLTATGSDYMRQYRSATTSLGYQYNRILQASQSNSAVSCPNIDNAGIVGGGTALLNGFTAITISAWIKVTAFTVDYAGIMWSRAVPGNNGFAYNTVADKKISFYVGGQSLAMSSNTVEVDGNWHHLVGTWATGGKINIYVDGTKTSSASTYSGTVAQSTAIYLGYDTFNSNRKFNGSIDEINIWNRALTDAEVAELYNSGAGVFADTGLTFASTGTSYATNLKIIHHASETSGTVLADSSGNGNTGVGSQWTTGWVQSAATAREITVWKSGDSSDSAEKGITTFGDVSSRTVLDGLTTRFNVAGVEKGQLGSTMAWTLPNTITGSTDAIQLKVISNATQTTNPFQIVTSADANILSVSNAGLIKHIGGAIISPSNDSTTALKINKADGTTNILTVDSTNARVGIGGTPTGTFHVFSPTGGINTGINLTQVANNGGASSSYTSIDFNVPTTGLTGQFFSTASNYSNAAINLAANSVGLFAEATSGQLALGAIGANGYMTFNTGGYAAANERMRITSGGNVGIGVTAPTARLHLPAGTATAGTAPLKFTSGTLLGTAEAGEVEFLTDDYYGTITSGSDGNYSYYPTAQNGSYVKADSNYSADYYPYFATDPTKPLIGTGTGNAWTTTNVAVPNVIQVDLGTAKSINRIYYENFHESGATTNAGIRAFTLWGSNTASAFASTNPAVDTDWTQITAGLSASEFDQHSASNVADPKYITMTATTAYRYYRVKVTSDWGFGTRRAVRRIELQDTTQASARKKFVLTDDHLTGLTSGRVPFATTNGRLTDNAGLTFDGSYLQVNGYKSSDGSVGTTTSGTSCTITAIKNGLIIGATCAP